MALDTNGPGSRPEHGIRRLEDLMFSMAGVTLGESQLVEGFLVRALRKEISCARMALTADEAYGLDFGRGGAVVAVTAVTGRGGHILFFEQGLGMDALLVFRELVRRDPVGFHKRRIGMAAAAGLGDIPGESQRLRILGRLNPMDSVAVRADSDLGVSFLEQLPVAERPVNLQLVDPEARVESPDISGI